MECCVYIARLDDLMDGDVTERERQAMEEHTRTCDDCRREREELDALLDGLSALGDEEAPEELRARVMSGVKDIRKRKRMTFFTKIGGGVAAALLLIAIPVALNGVGYYANNTSGTSAMYDAAPQAVRSAASDDMMKMMAAAGEYGAYDMGNDTAAYGMGASANSEPQMAESYAYAEDAAMEMESPAEAPAPVVERSAGALLSTNTMTEREAKRIMTGSLSINSKDFDADQQAILDMVNEMSGYIENSYSSGLPLETEPEYGGRTLSMSVRVPSQHYEVFMERVKGIGQLNWASENAQDITSQYYDTQTRMETLKIQYERLTDILAKSTELKDVLALETEMARVQYEIETLAGTLRHWDSQVDYSSVSIEVREVRKLERVTPVDPTLPERMYEGLITTMNGIVKFLESALVFVVSALPVIVVLAAVAVLLFFALRAAVRGRREKRNAGDPGKPPQF